MLKLLLLLSLAGIAYSKIYFPGIEVREPNINIRNVNGTEAWFAHVDNVISRGIFTLSQAFGEELTKKNSLNHDTNIIFSSVCVAEILALLLLGANGNTKQEIAKVLGFATGIDFKEHSYLVHEEFGRLLKSLQSFAPGDHETTSVASALFTQNDQGVSNHFVQMARNIYNSEVISNLDFKNDPYLAQTIINNWVNSKTSGKISTILDRPPSPSNRMIMVSTLYFNGEWVQPFSKGQRKPFYSNGYGKPTTDFVDMMYAGGEYLYYKDITLDCQIIGIPYKGGSTIFYGILPNDSDRTKLRKLQNSLTPDHLERLMSNLQPTRVVLLLPKMTITKTMSFKAILRTMGMASLFSSSTADLSAMFQYDNLAERITSGTNLYVDDILHKVQIEVNEVGTVGSAATMVSISKTRATPVKFDTPFMFIVRNERSKLDLFVGSIDLPEPSYKTS